jgi:FeS assembly SUF system protein
MGIFSFLTGSKTEDERDVAPSKTPAPAAPPVNLPEHLREARDHDSRTDWADGLDTGALTAPLPPTTSTDELQVGPLDAAITAELQPQIVEAVKTVYDPEIPVDIYELGLIYEIIADANRNVLIRMTLTSPACPSAQQLPSEVRYKVKAVPGVTDAHVEIVWEPPWSKERMSEAAKLALGFF